MLTELVERLTVELERLAELEELVERVVLEELVVLVVLELDALVERVPVELDDVVRVFVALVERCG